MFCTKCGFKFEESDARFCVGCGAAVEAAKVSQSETQPMQQSEPSSRQSDQFQSGEPIMQSQEQGAPTVYEAPVPPMYGQYVPPPPSPPVYEAPVPQMHQQTQPYATPPMYQQAQPYASQPTPKKKSKIWIPITAVAATLVLIFGALLLFNFSSLINGYSDGEDSIVDDTDRIIDEQPLVTEDVSPVSTTPARIEHQAGEVIMGDVEPWIPHLPPRPREAAVDIEWLDVQIISIEEFGVSYDTHMPYYRSYGRAVTETIIYYEVTNTHPEHTIEISCDVILINDVAITSTSLCQTIRAGDTVERRLILGTRLTYDNWAEVFILAKNLDMSLAEFNDVNVGDILTISLFALLVYEDEYGELVDEYLGRAEFTFTIYDIDEPGANAYEGWTHEHDEITLAITRAHTFTATDERNARTEFDFLILNHTDYDAKFGRVEVYVNGERYIEAEEFFDSFFYLPSNLAGRNTVDIDDLFISHGDIITVIGELRVTRGNANVTVEIIEFSIVL